ncbi:hypothetical protein FHU39_000922 [Flexivirga oryzae]|uniref:Uncharacterized protein n=1 Tax=Flexivirga oryzae TaxID=1794944 RepID=A0A839MZT4_9MICO|nr:hypothetical protein [Flexivirga oryzae]MBB2890938.1 hypothetical protein [Flexivirga oryzae]
MEQLEALSFECTYLAFGAALFLGAVGQDALDLVLEVVLYGACFVCGEVVVGVFVERFDALLDLLDALGLLAAGGALLVAPDTDEVRVRGAVPVGVDRYDHPRLTLQAPQAGLQEVRVSTRFLAVVGSRAKNCLYAVEGVLGDERVVLPVVFDPVVDDFAEVVTVAQALVQVAPGEGLGRPLGTRQRGQSASFEFISHRDDSPVAGGVGLECPAHQGAALSIYLNVATFDTVQELALVDVAGRCAAVGAAGDGLLVASLLDFLGEVVGVELVDRSQDAVSEFASGSLVDVLHDGDELDPGRFDGERDHDVVGSVAC